LNFLSKLKKQKIEVKKAVRELEECESIINFLAGNKFIGDEVKKILGKYSLKLEDLEKSLGTNHAEIDAAKRVIISLLKVLSHETEKSIDVVEKKKILNDNDLQQLRTITAAEQEQLGKISESFEALSKFARGAVSKATIGRRKFLKLAAGGAGWAIDAASGIGITTLLLNLLEIMLSSKARQLPKRETNALAILIGDAPLKEVELFKRIYVARIELGLNVQAKFVYMNAVKDDLFRCLADPTVQNIVIFAHGTNDSVSFLDGKIKSDHLSSDLWSYLENRREKDWDSSEEFHQKYDKKGILIRHSCGGDYEEDKRRWGAAADFPWGSLLFKQENIIHWKRYLNLLDILANPQGDKDHWSDKVGEVSSDVRKLILGFRR
ncbi:MAG: hypothetical protein AABY26_04045, partial [Nanoarchaeota archaeon]